MTFSVAGVKFCFIALTLHLSSLGRPEITVHFSSVPSFPYIAVPGNIAFLSLQTFITLSKEEDKVSKFTA